MILSEISIKKDIVGLRKKYEWNQFFQYSNESKHSNQKMNRNSKFCSKEKTPITVTTRKRYNNSSFEENMSPNFCNDFCNRFNSSPTISFENQSPEILSVSERKESVKSIIYDLTLENSPIMNEYSQVREVHQENALNDLFQKLESLQLSDEESFDYDNNKHENENISSFIDDNSEDNSDEIEDEILDDESNSDSESESDLNTESEEDNVNNIDISSTKNSKSKSVNKIQSYRKFATNKIEMTQEIFRLLNKEGFQNRFPDDLQIKWNKRLLTTAGILINVNFTLFHLKLFDH